MPVHAKPVARQGRKATGLFSKTAGMPGNNPFGQSGFFYVGKTRKEIYED
jgi:hypothetical protein